MVVKSYNIHDIIKLRIRFPDAALRNPFNLLGRDFDHYKVDHVDDPDIDVNVHKFFLKGKTSGMKMSEGRYYVGEKKFGCSGSRKFSKWDFFMDFSSGKCLMDISPNKIGYGDVSSGLIFPMARIIANNKGYAFIHAAGLSIDGQGHMLAGRHGSGKSTISMEAAKLGYTIYGDDWIILHKGKMYPFTSNLNVAYYNKSMLPEDVIKRNRKELMIKEILNKSTFGFVGLFTKISLADIFYVPSSPISLRNYTLLDVDVSDPARQLMLNVKMDVEYFLEYMMEYSFQPIPDDLIKGHWNLLEKNIADNIKGVKYETKENFLQRIRRNNQD